MKFVKYNLLTAKSRRVHHLACLGLTLFLAACATSTPQNIPTNEFSAFNAMPTQNRMMNNVRIKWEIRDDVAQHCARAYPMGREQAYLTPPLACAVWNTLKGECTIITGPLTSHVAIGHEVRHCFEGHFHR